MSGGSIWQGQGDPLREAINAGSGDVITAEGLAMCQPSGGEIRSLDIWDPSFPTEGLLRFILICLWNLVPVAASNSLSEISLLM
jgi:hypothetical protein